MQHAKAQTMALRAEALKAATAVLPSHEHKVPRLWHAMGGQAGGG